MIKSMEVTFYFSRVSVDRDRRMLCFYGATVPMSDPRCSPWREQADQEVMDTLREFARREGRCWKFRLRRIWENGEDADDPALRRARNLIGPSGLFKLKL
jgi:hypothetical protein